jgi:hypothetical protein
LDHVTTENWAKVVEHAERLQQEDLEKRNCQGPSYGTNNYKSD